MKIKRCIRIYVIKTREYTVVYNVIKNEQNKQVKYLMMLYWIDKTEYLNLAQKYEEEKYYNVNTSWWIWWSIKKC